MALRKLTAVVPVCALLALAAPVASANAQTTPVAASPASSIPCFPFPAFCNANGDPVGTLSQPYSFLIPLFRQLFGPPASPPSGAGGSS
jgi:hypothetical protein